MLKNSIVNNLGSTEQRRWLHSGAVGLKRTTLYAGVNPDGLRQPEHGQLFTE